MVKKYVTKKETLNDLKHTVSFKGNEEELNILAEWLASLKKNSVKKDSL